MEFPRIQFSPVPDGGEIALSVFKKVDCVTVPEVRMDAGRNDVPRQQKL